MGSTLVTGLTGSHVQTRQRRWAFKGDKNPQHAFLQRDSKVGGPMSSNFMACKKITCKYEKKFHKAKFIISFTHSYCLLPDDSAGRIFRELWWMNQECSCVSFIPPWFSMLIYQLGNEK
jgi:hypothetical protein